jgi:hypothetical protein
MQAEHKRVLNPFCGKSLKNEKKSDDFEWEGMEKRDGNET